MKRPARCGWKLKKQKTQNAKQKLGKQKTEISFPFFGFYLPLPQFQLFSISYFAFCFHLLAIAN
jgi:hypothetical protein